MFTIEGLFLDDMSHDHLTSIKSLSDYLDEVMGDELTPAALFSMQKQVYEIHQMGADALTKSAMQERPFECKAGCDACCHATDVDITPLEAFYLADFIRQQRKANQAIKIAPRKDIKAPCPLLKDGLCSSYEARPLSCRYIMSTDLASCLRRLETLKGGAKLPAPFLNFRTAISAACFITFKKRGLDARWLVLDQTIEQIVNDEDALQNWSQGATLDKALKADELSGQFGALVDLAR